MSLGNKARPARPQPVSPSPYAVAAQEGRVQLVPLFRLSRHKWGLEGWRAGAGGPVEGSKGRKWQQTTAARSLEGGEILDGLPLRRPLIPHRHNRPGLLQPATTHNPLYFISPSSRHRLCKRLPPRLSRRLKSPPPIPIPIPGPKTEQCQSASTMDNHLPPLCFELAGKRPRLICQLWEDNRPPKKPLINVRPEPRRMAGWPGPEVGQMIASNRPATIPPRPAATGPPIASASPPSISLPISAPPIFVFPFRGSEQWKRGSCRLLSTVIP